jgi:hypothetical protein
VVPAARPSSPLGLARLACWSTRDSIWTTKSAPAPWPPTPPAMATIAVAAVADARHVALNARRGLRRKGLSPSGQVAALVSELERTAALVEAVVAQTRIRLGGGVPEGSTRVVSLHDADARPIAKGRLGKPVEAVAVFLAALAVVVAELS